MDTSCPTKTPAQSDRCAQRGFTLIELMITVAIVAVLSSIAYPSYTAYIARGRRAEAQSQLMQAAQWMERFYAENYAYDKNTAGVAVTDATLFPARYSQSPTSGTAAYTIAVATTGTGATSTFTVTATRAGAMVGDKCGNFQITSTGVRQLVSYTASAGATQVLAMQSCWRYAVRIKAPCPASDEPARTDLGAGSVWRRLGVALTGAAALHIALAAAVGGGDSAGFLHPPAPLPPAASMQVRTVAAAYSPSPTPEPSTPDGSQSSAAEAGTTPATTPEPGKRYFDVSEVDAPAMPLPEWQVDVPMLMTQGVRSVSVDVLISENGVAQQCAVTRIEPQQPPTLQLAVASRLCETVLRPAQRRGVAVASVRHIELVLTSD